MAFSEHGNPFLTESTFSRAAMSEGTMTKAGTAKWLAVLILLVAGAASIGWNKTMEVYGNFDFTTVHKVDSGRLDSDGDPIKERVVIDPVTGEQGPVPNFDFAPVASLLWLGMLGALVVAMVVIFKQNLAPILAPLYAVLEGLALGVVSGMFQIEFDGIPLQAALISLSVMAAMYLLFTFGFVRSSSRVTTGVIGLMFGILLVYLGDMALTAFTGHGLSIVSGNGPWALGFSVLVCLVATWNFVIDFDTIEQGLEYGAPKYMEAYAAFGVLLTLVWLYVEILRLLAIWKSND